MWPVQANAFGAAPLLGIVACNRLIQLAGAYLVAVVRDDEIVAPLEVNKLVEVVKDLTRLSFS